MISRIIFIVSFFLFNIIHHEVTAQDYFYPINRDMETRVQRYLASDTSGFFSSMKPYTMSELRAIAPVDSVWQPIVGDGKFYKSWVGRKLRKEHFIEANEDDFLLAVDPVFNFQGGHESKRDINTYVNTKGVRVTGSYKNHFFFFTQFHENQARYVQYVDSFVNKYQVVPGQGRVKFLDNDAYDFSQATGGIAYSMKHFDFVLAHDKMFVGDGYRSLLLSDNTYSYPFLRLSMNFWKFKYTVVYSVMRDMQTPHDPNVGFYKKYNTSHYLDFNIGKKNKLTAGIFETIMWEQAASRGYELSYLNPILFLRPVENSLDSPDNVILGINAKWKALPKHTFYGQFLMDEFIIDNIKAGNGWWGNKFGIQGGVKSSDLFNVSNLNFQTEFNLVRPYTFQHRSNSQNYTHDNQALAHPLGANFAESVTFVNYRWKNFFGEFKFQYAKASQDTGGINYGNDIFKDYLDHGDEYGHYMFDGLEYTLKSIDIRIDYLVNPRTNFNIELGTTIRRFNNIYKTDDTQLIYFGIRTSLENYYWDF
jgi:hypothetical protein